MSYQEWKTTTEELAPQGLFICMICGEINSDYPTICEGCADPNGGDGPDD